MDLRRGSFPDFPNKEVLISLREIRILKFENIFSFNFLNSVIRELPNTRMELNSEHYLFGIVYLIRVKIPKVK